MTRYFALLTALLFLTGCDETGVLPFAEHENYFTVFGYLDAATDSQFVRVIPIRLKLGRPDAADEIDGEVYLHALEAGTTRQWDLQQEMYEDGSRGLRFDDGSFGFVFLGRTRPVPGHTYELEIRRSDGKTTRARTTVPVVAAPVVEAPRVVGDSIYQEVLVPGVSQPPAQIRIAYLVVSPLFDMNEGEATIALPYTEDTEAVAEGRQLDLNLTHEARRLRAFIAANLSQYTSLPSLEDVATFPLALQDMRLSVGVRDDAWDFVSDPPDLARLSQPGAASNVENGLGFFGAVGWGFTLWELDEATKDAIGLLGRPE